MTFHVISLFPESLDSYINESIVARAQKEGYIKIRFYNPRDFVKVPATKLRGKNAQKSPYKRVDDKPYGGGPGMVMQAEPIIKAIEKAQAKIKSEKSTKSARSVKNVSAKITKNVSEKTKIIFLSPAGKQFTNEYAHVAVQKFDHIIIICGRYEGIDARVRKIFKAEEISVGPYVLTGGELGAMIIIDAMSRQIEGVLGDFNSLEELRVSSSEVYTRPEILIHKGKKYRVPKVLLSGHRAKIDQWKQSQQSRRVKK